MDTEATGSCRTCLSKEDLSPIFLRQEHSDRYTFALFLTTGLQIQYDDGLSQKICKPCVDTINSYLQFRSQCHESEKALLLQSANQRLKSKSEPQIETDLDSDFKQEYHDDVAAWSDSEYTQPPAKTHEFIIKDEVAAEFAPKNKRGRKKKRQSHPKIEKVTESEILSIKQEDVDLKADELTPNGLCLDVNSLKQKIRNSESARAVKEEKKQMYESLIVGGRTNNGPFECKICGKVLKIWSSFRTHAKIHLGFDFMCEHCGKKFVAVTMLRRHLMALHGAEKTYICKTCGHKEHNSDRLKIHMRRMHTGERPYVCDKCGADFFSRRYLIFHLAVHETQRNHQCQQCPAKFKSPQRLACHVSKVHRLRGSRLACYLCESSYTKCENVKRHVVKVHGAASWHKGRVRRVAAAKPLVN